MAGSTNDLVTNDPLEVCLLAQQDRVSSSLYPPRYRAAFAFSSFLCPASPSTFLAVRFPPKSRDAGFTMFHTNSNERVSPRLYTGST